MINKNENHKNINYPGRDFEIVDYQTYKLGKTNISVRGPKTIDLNKNNYFTCVGSAHTFGCFAEKPYPKLLEESLSIPSLNLGFGGAIPETFYLHKKELINYINDSQFAVIQIVTARTISNSLFQGLGYGEKVIKKASGIKISADQAYEDLIEKLSHDELHEIVEETRRNYLETYKKLLEKIKVPKILLWFSVREPYYEDKYEQVKYCWQLFKGFPQLVNHRMVEELKEYCDDYVECVSKRGHPQLLVSRFTGEAVEIVNFRGIKKTHNQYYPSPEMHVDVAQKLNPVCQKYILNRNKKIAQKSYVICTTPRSGSNLLCGLLTSSKILGKPNEVLNVDSVLRPFCEKHNLFEDNFQISMNNYLNCAREKRHSKNNVFGVKILFDQLEPLLDSKEVRQLLQTSKLIWLVRKDVVAQAVSMYIAKATDEWDSIDEQRNKGNESKSRRDKVQYDGKKINNYLDYLVKQNLQWLKLFSVNQIEYLQVYYEDLLLSPQQVCQDICKFCGVETHHEFSIDSVRFKKQGNELNERFANTFRQESSLNLSIKREDQEIQRRGITIVATAKTYLKQGKEFTDKGNFIQAVACYKKALEENPELYEAYLRLGDAFRYQKEFDKAINLYDKAIEIHTKVDDLDVIYSRLALISQEKGLEKPELEKISKIARKGIEESPNHVKLRRTLLYCLGALGKKNEAIKVSQKATRTNVLRRKKKFFTEHFDDKNTGQPDFIIIGFRKCATTSLYHYIIEHPQILPASIKEIMFFNNEQLYGMGIDWYRANFPAIPQNCNYVTGEASTLYIQYSKVAQRLKASFPNTKLIVILRNPVDRAISSYYFDKKLGNKLPSLQKAINAQIKAIQEMQDIRQSMDGDVSLVSIGLYVYFLEKWMNLFPRHQFLILKAEDLAKNTQETCNQVFSFLGLPNYRVTNTARKNKGSYEFKDQDLYRQLTEFYQPYNHKLEEYLGVKFNW